MRTFVSSTNRLVCFSAVRLGAAVRFVALLFSSVILTPRLVDETYFLTQTTTISYLRKPHLCYNRREVAYCTNNGARTTTIREKLSEGDRSAAWWNCFSDL